MAGLTAGYELYTATTNASVDTDTTSVGATYGMGDITLAIENNTTETAAGVLQQISHLWAFITLWVVAFTLFAEQKMMRKIRLQRPHTWVHRSSSNSLTA